MRRITLSLNVAVWALLTSVGAFAQVTETKASTNPYDLIVVGDVMLGRLVDKEMAQSKRHPWTKLGTSFPSAKIQIGNFEAAVLSPDDIKVAETGIALHCVNQNELCLTAPKENILALKQAGFTHMSLANNHTADLGLSGKLQTRAALIENKITPLDAESGVQFETIGEQRIAFVALSMVPDAVGHVAHIPSRALEQKMHLAHSLSDKVVIIIHWGNELQTWVSQQQRDAAQWLIAHGADMIFGHHPHVVQAAECILGKQVWFSLGNHVFDQKYPQTHTGAIAACRFSGETGNQEPICERFLSQRSNRSSSIENVYRDAETPALQCKPSDNSSQSTIHERKLTTKFPAELLPKLWANLDVQTGTYDLQLARKQGAKSVSLIAQALPLRKLEQFNVPGETSSLVMLLELASPFDQSVGLRPHVYSLRAGHLFPLWRGSALAYPIEDLSVRQTDQGEDFICVLHEASSHLGHVPIEGKDKIILAYRWNGFGFKVDENQTLRSICESVYSVNGTSTNHDKY